MTYPRAFSEDQKGLNAHTASGVSGYDFVPGSWSSFRRNFSGGCNVQLNIGDTVLLWGCERLAGAAACPVTV